MKVAMFFLLMAISGISATSASAGEVKYECRNARQNTEMHWRLKQNGFKLRQCPREAGKEAVECYIYKEETYFCFVVKEHEEYNW